MTGKRLPTATKLPVIELKCIVKKWALIRNDPKWILNIKYWTPIIPEVCGSMLSKSSHWRQSGTAPTKMSWWIYMFSSAGTVRISHIVTLIMVQLKQTFFPHINFDTTLFRLWLSYQDQIICRFYSEIFNFIFILHILCVKFKKKRYVLLMLIFLHTEPLKQTFIVM